MKKFPTSHKTYVKKSHIPNSGRGVYAACDIKIGEIIEMCPIIEISEYDIASLNESSLINYFFYFGNKRQRQALALGFGSIYNHTYKPNARYKIKPTEKRIDFIALDDIKKDDEILVNYIYENPKVKSPLWFEAS